MKDYLSIVRRGDFIDLFKYGHLYVCHAVCFCGDVKEHACDDPLFERLTSRMNVYEYSFEYLIIHFVSEQEDSPDFSVGIGSVRGIYAFDADAAREMTTRFDPRIRIDVSPWADKFAILHQKLLISQSMLGIDNIWAIFDLPKEDIAKCKDIIPDSAVNEAFNLLYSGKPAAGELSIWTYLLRYERHSFYPRGMRGYFCDLVHIVCNWMKHETIVSAVAEETDVYKEIISSPDDKFKTLVKVLERSQLSSKTLEATRCIFTVTAPLFLYLKGLYADGMEPKPDKAIVEAVKGLRLEGSLALYLLGITLGYDKTYDALYESADFPFLKKTIECPQVDANCENSAPSNVEENEPPYQQGMLFSEDSCSNEPAPYAWVRKGSGKRTSIRQAKTADEYRNLLNEGYSRAKNFTRRVCEEIKKLGYNPNAEKKRLQGKKF